MSKAEIVRCVRFCERVSAIALQNGFGVAAIFWTEMAVGYREAMERAK